MSVVEDAIQAALSHALRETQLEGVGERVRGKVRDIYLQPGRRLLVASDRLSAFDRIIGAIPYKGQVLNQISAWWFRHTADIVPNHVLATPDPNVTVAVEAVPLKIEMVVRGYITGVTDTALWTLYENGVERPYGLTLPAGLRKNDRLPTPVITPTTKGEPGEHDERLSCAEVVERGLVAPGLWQEVQRVALALFARGTELAARQGLILVDTKYEFGLVDGRLTLIDEVHTPDSSRYWLADTWTPEAEGRTPRSLDKEYARTWLKQQGYAGEGVPPTLPDDVRAEVARRYIRAFERLTGETFVPAAQPPAARIQAALAGYALAGGR